MKTYYAALRHPGSLWDPEKTAREQPYWDDHAIFMDAMFETGVVILGGPFADRSGSLVILKVESAARVRELFANDPWTLHDVLQVGEVKEWTIFLDSREHL